MRFVKTGGKPADQSYDRPNGYGNYDGGRHSLSPGSEPDSSYSPLVGSQARVESPRYRCPVANCHQSWYRHEAEEAIPHCPIHDVVLVRDSKVH